MAGNRVGGLKARDTNMKRHGADFYEKLWQHAKHYERWGEAWEANRARALSMYKRGASFLKISREIQIPYHTTYRRIKKELERETNEN